MKQRGEGMFLKRRPPVLVALVQPEGDEGRVLPIDLVRELLSG
jgi:hypothetical protein